MTNSHSNPGLSALKNDARIESLLEFLGPLFELSHEGLVASGHTPPEVAMALVNLAAMCRVSHDDYAEIVRRGATYRATITNLTGGL